MAEYLTGHVLFDLGLLIAGVFYIEISPWLVLCFIAIWYKSIFPYPLGYLAGTEVGLWLYQRQ